MLIPASSVTDRHQIRMRLPDHRDTGWLDVYTVTPAADGQTVRFDCGLSAFSFTVKTGSKVDARLPLHTFHGAGLTLTRIGDADERGENSTYQGNEVVAYSIATRLELPPHVANDVDAAAEFLNRFFDWAALQARLEGYDLAYEVEVGPDTAADPRSYMTAAVE